MQYRYDGTILDVLQTGKLCLHPSGVVFFSLFIQKETGGPAQIGDPPVRVYAHVIFRTHIGLSVDVSDIDNGLIIQRRCGHGEGIQVKNALAAFFSGREVAVVVFIVKLYRKSRHRITDGFIVQFR